MAELYGEGDERRYITENKPGSPERDEFRRDFARVIHCPSFRRLQGKTQLFPGHESDFFRNRLTHSLEVAQIAESIAHCINHRHSYFREHNINPRICFTAALLHDIGHPPFGHNGEEALDEAMRTYGGFEGNAQTLRIVTQIEKKRFNPGEACPIARRAGLNLTYRTLGAVLKYDKEIAEQRAGSAGVAKGYYREDKPIVEDIKRFVAPGWTESKCSFKTVECSIMDFADDIAYSTYDLEDSFKANFLTPSRILTSDRALFERVAERVAAETGDASFDALSVIGIFSDMFQRRVSDDAYAALGMGTLTDDQKLVSSMDVVQQLDSVAESGELRTEFTSALVNEFIDGVEVELNEEFPQLSRIRVHDDVRKKVETLKRFTYEATIISSRVKLSEFRGKEVVKGIFEALDGKRGGMLLPDDVLRLYRRAEGEEQKKKRVICDFIAGMTDRYALEFYGRLHSESPQTIFKPT